MTKKLFILVVLLLVSIPAFAQVVDTGWVRRYDGPGNSVDYPFDIAVDGSGNVYVTGKSEGGRSYLDYATIKYDSSGTELWVMRYNGPGDSTDCARAIAVDSSGNVYVTGYSWGSGTGFDYATIKYYPNGDTAWVRRYDGPANYSDYAYDIAVDISGNVFVTGKHCAGDPVEGYDYATIKYDPSGNLAWVKKYYGAAEYIDEARAVALDGSGNIYVSGFSYGAGTLSDFLTIKYDQAGNELWIKSSRNPIAHDEPEAMAVDDSGNVYVTGGGCGIYGTAEFITVKYDTWGNEIWVRNYAYSEHIYDYAYDITVDLFGNVYVTGESAVNGQAIDSAAIEHDTHENEIWSDVDYATVKYDAEGNEIWVRRYSGTGDSWNCPWAIAIDKPGNVYVTGISWGGLTDYDYATIKYDGSGNQLWVKRYTTPGYYWDEARGIAVDDSSNVYVTGITNAYGTHLDYLTIKYVQSFRRGEVDQDGAITITDVVYLINYLFRGGPAPAPEPWLGDVNCDDNVDIIDVVYLINYVFRSGSPPCL